MSERSGRRKVRRVAVVGIDGCGKSTVLDHLRRLAPDHLGAFACITCPDYHDTPDAPLQALSQRLAAFSQAADEIGSLEAKVLALYLQMTLYGPVERFFLDTFAPEVMVCERHPMVESLVYGPLYVKLGDPTWDGSRIEPEMQELLEDTSPRAMHAVRAWHRAEAARLDLDLGLWDWPSDIAAMVQQALPTRLATFAGRYRSAFPDEVVWLDLPPDQAAARCAARSSSAEVNELHETPQLLIQLRSGYERTRLDLADALPEVRFHIVDTSDGVDIDDSVHACIDKARLFG